jgi:hypothetical protein
MHSGCPAQIQQLIHHATIYAPTQTGNRDAQSYAHTLCVTSHRAGRESPPTERMLTGQVLTDQQWDNDLRIATIAPQSDPMRKATPAVLACTIRVAIQHEQVLLCRRIEKKH